MRKIILLLGAPGSGKGTQSAIISREMLLPHISTGDIFREMATKESPEAKLLNEYLSSGKLYPDKLVNRVITDYLTMPRYSKGFILDGYPRDLNQLDYFITHVSASFAVIFFEIESDFALKRIIGRFSCKYCRKLYNKFFLQPIEKGICDDCGGKEFIHRSDDDEVVIKTRLNEFTEKTMPVIDYLQERPSFYRVDGSRSINEVSQEVKGIIADLNNG